jgi:hypothetical protein
MWGHVITTSAMTATAAVNLLSHDAFQAFVAQFPFLLEGGEANDVRDDALQEHAFFDGTLRSVTECYIYNHILCTMPRRQLVNLSVQLVKLSHPSGDHRAVLEGLLDAKSTDALRSKLCDMLRGHRMRQLHVILLLQSALL